MISRRRLWIFVACLGILTVGAIALALRIPFTSETLRKRVIETLSDRLDAEVELGDLTLRVLPALHADGTDLRIRHKGRRDVAPLISIDKFTVDADSARPLAQTRGAREPGWARHPDSAGRP